MERGVLNLSSTNTKGYWVCCNQNECIPLLMDQPRQVNTLPGKGSTLTPSHSAHRFGMGKQRWLLLPALCSTATQTCPEAAKGSSLQRVFSLEIHCLLPALPIKLTPPRQLSHILGKSVSSMSVV